MNVVGMALVALAVVASVALTLVLLPKWLEARGDLPYNSVRSRLVAWFAFGTLLTTIAALAGGTAWDAGAWASWLALLAVAVAWDLYDLRTRRIPRGRHPDR